MAPPSSNRRRKGGTGMLKRVGVGLSNSSANPIDGGIKAVRLERAMRFNNLISPADSNVTSTRHRIRVDEGQLSTAFA